MIKQPVVERVCARPATGIFVGVLALVLTEQITVILLKQICRSRWTIERQQWTPPDPPATYAALVENAAMLFSLSGE